MCGFEVVLFGEWGMSAGRGHLAHLDEAER
jgi:hypothetical protein